ncbi:hypothetical protein LTR10_002544 [Elasticomyces elasticus]|nr:hypothetical protein LTR10_002544 [Elasticomyces elasticus]
MSCSVCQKIFIAEVHLARADSEWGTIESGEVHQHHEDISGLCQSALNQCRICTDVWRHFFKQRTPEQYAQEPLVYNGNNGDDATGVHIYLGSGSSYRFVELSEHLRDADTPKDAFMIEFDLHGRMDRDVKQFAYVLRPASKTDSIRRRQMMTVRLQNTYSGSMNMGRYDRDAYEKDRWERIRKWIANCRRNHKSCTGQRLRMSVLPSRVLVVPRRTNKTDYRIALLDTRKNLHVSYVWIDSLCIIQGDREDWIKESTRMEEVYANAYLNISATSGASPTDGLKSSHEMHPRLLNVGMSGDACHSIYQLVDVTFWRNRVTDAFVNSRGWVVQERVLASRVLHYTFDQVAWECLEFSAAEEFPDGLPHEVKWDIDGPFKQMSVIGHDRTVSKGTATTTLSGSVTSDLHNDWARIVRLYSRCDLTKPNEDKLVAISGLARAMQKQLKHSSYLAGLWSDNIYGGLLWKVDRGRKAIRGVQPDRSMLSVRRYGDATRADVYRAPSWSWVSVDGIVKLWDYMDVSGKPIASSEPGLESASLLVTPRATILDVSIVVREDKQPLGQVKAGQLAVSGRLYRYRYETDSWFKALQFRATGEFAAGASVDEGVEWTIFDSAWFLPLVLRKWVWEGSTPALFQSTQDTELEVSESDEALRSLLEELVAKRGSAAATDWRLPEARAWADRQLLRRGVGYHDIVLGLVLTPSSNGDTFKRIGIATISKSTIDRLDDTGQVPQWEEELSDPKVSVSSAEALEKEDLVQGVFVIV